MKAKHLIPAVILLCLGGAVRADLIYLADDLFDAGPESIDRFDSSGTWLGSFLVNSYGLTMSSLSVALDASGNIYTATSPGYLGTGFGGNEINGAFFNGGILKFDPTGNLLNAFEGPASNGLGLALDASGNIFETLSDSNGYSKIVEKVSPTGVDLGVFATITNGTAAGLAFDHSGNLYVAIGGGTRAGGVAATDGNGNPIPDIEEFDSTGHDLGNFLQSYVDNPDQAGFPHAGIRSVYFDAAGNLYCTDYNSGFEFSATGAPIFPGFGVLGSFPDAAIGVLSNGETLVTNLNGVGQDDNGSVFIDTSDPSTPFYDFEQNEQGFQAYWTGMAIQSTPEPASAALALLGAGLLLAMRKRPAGL